MPTINIDTILSDPLLIVASVLLVVSPVVFLVALVKFIRTPKAPKAKDPFAIPHEDFSSPISSLAPDPVVEEAPAPAKTESAPQQKVVETPAPAPAIPAAERTVVLPAGVADIQAQLEIALTQIRTLNKKVIELEGNNSKLQTIAEHVIALERDMAGVNARLKGESSPAQSAPSVEKRPPMPL